MKKLSTSVKIYIVLILILAILSAVSIFLLESQSMLPTQELPASKPVLVIANAGIVLVFYGGLGFLGLKLAQKIDFSDIWDSKISNRQRFLIPAIVGIGIGVLIIIGDAIFSQFHDLGPLPHPPFPSSIIASITAGIGEEVIFRLFFISFWVWLISNVILRKRYNNQVFWIMAVISAVAFAAGHIPSLMILFEFETLNDVPPAVLVEGFLLNGVLSIFTAYYFRKYGFLAAVGIHFWADFVWHVIRGLF